MAYLVGIYDDGTQFSQELRHRALATANSAGKTDNFH
jgi:hypothetical protein